MVGTFIQYIIIVLVILLLIMLARKLKIAYPIVLVVGGLLISLVPGVPTFEVDPELIFILFLPPLLYEAAWQTSWKNFWRFRRVIFSFAFLIVILTSLVVAFIASNLIPGFTMALGFLLGGIISPPDAVSATSIMKNVKVPKSFVSIVEGESLLNDASSLIVFRFALVAVDTGNFIFREAAMSFVLVIAAGIVIGLAIAFIFYMLHKWLPTTTNTDIILTLLGPYAMYIAAESVHVSGVLAVVSGGLFLSSKRHIFLSPKSRLHGANVWSALAFILNGLVFMLIGLELTIVVEQLEVSIWTAIGYGLLITVILIISRLLSTLGASAFTVFISRFITTANSRPGWRSPLVLGWAGMRGVVSLAAALSIPISLSDGRAFPERSLILFITFMVIMITLVLQGLTLPWLVKKLKIVEHDSDELMSESEQDIVIRKKLSEAGLQMIEKKYKDQLSSSKHLQNLQLRYKTDKDGVSINDGERDQEFKEVYLSLLEHQRAALLQINKRPEMDESIIRKYEELLDLEEEKLQNLYK